MSFMVLFMYSSNVMMFMWMMWMNFLMKESELNMMMIFMTFMMMKMIFFSMKEKMNNYFFFFKKKILSIMFILLILFFYTKKMMNFYIYFEMISMTIFLLIFFSSFSNQRLKASIYMFLFMGMSTFPMLVMMFMINQKTMMLIFFLGFLIKMPIMFFHLWLPKAHVEANFYDSMILASLLLKLGGYGILLININKKMNFFFFWMMVSILFLSINMIFLTDMKMIFAYSSIIHMNGMILMMLSNNYFTEKMFIIMMISHAISSSLMFYIIGMIYENTFSRSMMINKNFMLNNLILFMVIFFTMFINMATPPMMNFFSEMYMYMSIMNYSKKTFIMLIYMMLVSMIFNLMVLKNLGMSKFNKFFKLNELKMKNFTLIKEHMFLLVLM